MIREEKSYLIEILQLYLYLHEESVLEDTEHFQCRCVGKI